MPPYPPYGFRCCEYGQTCTKRVLEKQRWGQVQERSIFHHKISCHAQKQYMAGKKAPVAVVASRPPVHRIVQVYFEYARLCWEIYLRLYLAYEILSD